MPANTSPIFTLTPNVEWTITNMVAANTGNLSAGTSYIVWTAAANGSYLQKIRFRHQSSNTNSAATVARVWITNGGSLATVANYTLWDEITIAANTASQVAAATNYELPLNFAIPAGYTIYCTLGTAILGGLLATIVGGDY
jgi:hypothetical protein